MYGSPPTLEDQRGHGRSHRRALGRSSACLPASVIRTRVTSIARSPAITRSVVTLASPALISSTNRSLLKPCARRIAAVQPSGDAASNSKRPLALGAAARVLCHFRHALDVSSAYEIGESKAMRRSAMGAKEGAPLGNWP